VTAVMTYFGLPPSLPDFDKLADEGLDYAIGIATSEMGFECNKQCRDLIKKGFKAVSSGENLFQAGLDLGADMAAKELDKIGVNCDQKCKNLIKDGVQGKATFGQATDAALDQATNQIVQKLQSEGYLCDAACKAAIRSGLEQGNVIGGFASSAAQPQPEPLFVPHPLATEQQAVVEIELFRRWESASIPAADVAKCNLAVYNQASSTNFSQPVTGKLFSDEGASRWSSRSCCSACRGSCPMACRSTRLRRRAAWSTPTSSTPSWDRGTISAAAPSFPSRRPARSS